MSKYSEELTSIKLEILSAIQEARNAAADIQKVSSADLLTPGVLEAARSRIAYSDQKMKDSLVRLNKLMSESVSS
jgi:hypothetical protein